MRPLFITVATGSAASAATYIGWPLWRWWPVMAWMAGTVITVSLRDAIQDDDPDEDIATLTDFGDEEEGPWTPEEWAGEW